MLASFKSKISNVFCLAIFWHFQMVCLHYLDHSSQKISFLFSTLSVAPLLLIRILYNWTCSINLYDHLKHIHGMDFMTNTTVASKYILNRSKICINQNLLFQTPFTEALEKNIAHCNIGKNKSLKCIEQDIL